VNKSDLIVNLKRRQTQLSDKDIELSVKTILEHMIDILCEGKRIEIRGFGVFSVHHRRSRIGRNPSTGESVSIPAKSVACFKPGKELRERVNGSS